MKRIVNKLSLVVLVALLVGVWIASCAGPARAQDTAGAGMKKLAVVSVSSYNELIKDIGFIGSLGGKPGVAQKLEGLLLIFTQGQGLQGLDKTQPWGVIARVQGEQFEFVGCLPVKDLQQLLNLLQSFDINVQPADGGAFQITGQGQTLFVKPKAGWAFVAQSSDALRNLPDNPAAELRTLSDKYDLGVRLYAQNLPPMYKEMAVAQLTAGAESGLERSPDESDEQFAMKKELVHGQIRSMSMIINETDELTFGWTIDADQQNTSLEFSLVATPGSPLAEQASKMSQLKSDFLGFKQPNAAATLNAAGSWSDEEKIRMIAMLDVAGRQALQAIEDEGELPDAEARDLVKAAFDDLIQVAKDTVQEGKFDMGAVLNLEPKSITLAAGGFLADGKAVERALKKLASLAEAEPDFEGVQWDSDKHEGVTFHTLGVPIPAEEDEARQLLGDTLEVVVGIGGQSVYVAFGREGTDTLKSAIDQSRSKSDQSMPPLAFAASLSRILKFAAAHDNDPNLQTVASAMAEGSDQIRINAQSIENGFSYRIDVETGVLKALGQAAAAVQRGIGGPGAPF